MDLKLLAPLFAIAIAIGWFFPESSPKQQPANDAQAQAVQAVPAAEASGGGGFDPVILDRKPDGHFYATADVGGTPIRFLVDTGASMIALTGEDARALGFSWSQNELQLVGRAVNGDVYGKPVMLDNFSIGDVEFNNMRAVIVPEMTDISLLGQSFLERVDNVTIEQDRMTLGD